MAATTNTILLRVVVSRVVDAEIVVVVVVAGRQCDEYNDRRQHVKACRQNQGIPWDDDVDLCAGG